MRAILLAAALLAPAGCNRGSAPTAAPASTAPTVDNAFLVGRWTDSGDCGNATDFAADGQFRTSGGAGGQWTLAGDRLTLSGAMTLTAQVVAVDRNTIEIVNPDGSRGRSTRC